MTSITTTLFSVMLTFASALMLTPETTATDTVDAEKVALPLTPKVKPALVDGFDDIASYEQSVSDRLTELKTRLDETKDLNLRTKLLLAEANHILAYQLEPACTSILLRIDPPSAPTLPYFKQVDLALDRASKTLDELKSLQENPDDQVRQISRSLDILRSFNRALRAYLLKDADEPDREARRAATGLSALVEQDDAQIRSAALFWQACLRGLEEDPSSALSRLDYALQSISKATRPFSFYSRLLRCRLLADHESYPLTLSLLLQMEEHSLEWFFDAPSRKQSTTTLSLMRIQTLREWHDHLDDKRHNKERQWCAKQIQQLIDSRFDGDRKSVMRLLPAIPIIVPIPE